MEKIFSPRPIRWGIVGALGWFVLVLVFVVSNNRGTRLGAAPVDRSAGDATRNAGLKAFTDVASVLRSPRCLNCHPAGDVPRQTDAQQPHFPAVARGADGHGLIGMRCNACHQDENQLNGVPGAPHWGLAPRPMAWAGLNDYELAEQLKDPERNGHRTLEQMIDHVSTERLVLWAWIPGGNRPVPPLTHEQFVQRFKDWVAAGAPSPQAHKE